MSKSVKGMLKIKPVVAEISWFYAGSYNSHNATQLSLVFDPHCLLSVHLVSTSVKPKSVF